MQLDVALSLYCSTARPIRMRTAVSSVVNFVYTCALVQQISAHPLCAVSLVVNFTLRNLTPCTTNITMAANADTGNPKIFDKPGKHRSNVWKYFGFALDEETQKLDKSKVLCKTCAKPFTYTGNTSNLWSHVTINHPQLKPTKTPAHSAQTSIQQFSSTPLAFNSAKSTAITNAMAEYLVLDMKPLATVDSAAFQHMFSKAEPRYKVPSRSFFKDSKIPDMYEATKTKIMADLRKSSQVALTTDCWTSSATQSYRTVTAHYITSNWELQNLVLQTRKLACSHTADNLADALVKCVDEWQIIPSPVV